LQASDRIAVDPRESTPLKTALLTVLLAAASLLLAPAEAFAHLHLTASAPAADETVSAVPTHIRLTFTEQVELGFSDLALIGPLGEVRIGDLFVPVDSEAVLEVRILGQLVAGDYTVRWQAASADGHPVRGEYRFAIPAGAVGLIAETAEPASAAPAPPAVTTAIAAPPRSAAFGVESPGYVAVRWGTFAALLAVIGTVGFRLLVLGRLKGQEALVEAAAPRAARLGLWAAAFLLIAAFLRLAAESMAVLGDVPLGGRMIGIVLTTLWGWGWLVQVGGTLVALAGFLLARRGSDLGWTVAALGAVLLAFFSALSGHAAAVEGSLRPHAIVVDGLHVFGAGGWLGSLLVLLVAGLPTAVRLDQGKRSGALSELVATFSGTALVFAGIVVFTGVVASWIHLGSIAALVDTPYGRTLLVKLAVVAVVAGAGAFNWRRVRPALGGTGGEGRLRRSAAFELAAGLFVLAVTAALVATPPPGS
jgi:copper transport protein